MTPERPQEQHDTKSLEFDLSADNINSDEQNRFDDLDHDH